MEELAARRLRLVPDEYDQVLRLHRFREDHPAVVIGAGNGWWQAVIPAPDGEIVTTRYTLRALLDKLDELLGARPRHRPSRPCLPRHLPDRTQRAADGGRLVLPGAEDHHEGGRSRCRCGDVKEPPAAGVKGSLSRRGRIRPSAPGMARPCSRGRGGAGSDLCCWNSAVRRHQVQSSAYIALTVHSETIEERRIGALGEPRRLDGRNRDQAFGSGRSAP